MGSCPRAVHHGRGAHLAIMDDRYVSLILADVVYWSGRALAGGDITSRRIGEYWTLPLSQLLPVNQHPIAPMEHIFV
jgi:hypothetical protein